MKNLHGLLSKASIMLLLIVAGCKGGYNGQLLGELDRPKWNPITPYGMVFIPSGVLHIGPSDQDVNDSHQSRSKQVSIVGFYMDDTEITNNEYRQFIDYVRDSVAHKIQGDAQTAGADGDEAPIDWNKKIEWGGGKKGGDQSKLEEIYLPK